MNKLKVCFIGVGSIARRHIENFYSICQDKKITLTVDALRRHKGDGKEYINRYINQIYTDIEKLPDNYDVIFITNPTEFHLEMLRKLHNHAQHFFIEKPLTSYKRMEETFKIKYRNTSVYYIACPLRYTSVIQYLKENLDVDSVISVRCICSSYLPDWRPGIDYRQTYSASQDLGGGVRMDLIHEWDYIKFLFGKPENIFCTFGKKSPLEVQCEDYAVYVADYKDKIIELHLDYFGRKAIREIMMITNRDTIIGDLVNNKIQYLKENREIRFQEERNDYQKRELKHFLSMIEGKAVCDNGIMDAYQTLLLAQGEIK
ncbi:Gfo/Idh/MocA family oxidoreductase [Lachnospiraceae bacterium 62-35]